MWRCLELFDELNLPAAHLINTTVFDYAPQIVDALKARGDEFIGHGRTNAERHGGMWEADEKRFLEEMRDVDREGLGQAAARLDGAVDGLDALVRPIS